MSSARKCDGCGTFFEPELECLRLDVHAATDINDAVSWSGIDLCLKCSAPVLDQLESACNGLADYRKGKY